MFAEIDNMEEISDIPHTLMPRNQSLVDRESSFPSQIQTFYLRQVLG